MLKKHKLYLNLTWLFIILLLPFPLVITLKMGLPEIFQSDFLAITFGVVAYTWMLAVIFLSTKPKWLDNLIGLPDMYLIHGVLSIFALGLLYLHKFNIPSVGWIKQIGDISLYIYTGVIAYSLIFLAGWLTSRIKFLLKIKKTLERVFKHEISIWLHRLNVIATIGGFIHVLIIDYIVNITPFFVILCFYFFYTFISYFIFLYKKSRKRKGRVSSVKLLTDDMVEITISAEKSQIDDINAGDFSYISFGIDKMKELHPFSIQNVPSKNNEIKFAIEMVGDFTKNLVNIKSGEEAYFTKGYGILNRLVKSHKGKVVFLGGGAGVVPLLSLAEFFEDKDITFLYTAKKEKGLLYEDLFKKWNLRDNFKSYLQKGRFSKEDLETKLPIGEEYIYIIAGPMNMNISYKKYLKDKGVSAHQIYFESFNF